MAEFVPHNYYLPDPDPTDRAPLPGIGFVGCKAAGRLLRVRVANRNRQIMRVTCPNGCGEHATAHAMARPLRRGEAEPELAELPPAQPTPPQAPADPARLTGRQSVTDAAIFDAIPTRDVIAAEVAERLGYVVPANGASIASSLLERLRRMNRRAAKAGEPEPFVIDTRVGTRKPALVRRRPQEQGVKSEL
jgi:hypothetical protein